MLAIQLHSLSKSFPNSRSPAVHNLSLSISPGSLFFLLGPSGCGKTTLLRMIAGFTFPSSGTILFDNTDISAVPPHRRDIGMVFQSYALWPHMTVADNIAFGLNVRKLPKNQRDLRIAEVLKLVQMEEHRDRRPNQLSGGQQQRVALARALAIRPRCLLLDEPLSNLDAKLRLDMRSEIRRIVKLAGITAIYVTHDQKEALSMADTIAVMNHGTLEQVGTPADLYRRPASRFVAQFIGESNFLTGTLQSISATTLLIKTPAGNIMARNPHPANNPPAPNSSPAPARNADVPSAVVAPTTTPVPVAPALGTQVQLAFRPESISLANPNSRPPADANLLRGTRLSSTYLGDLAEHLIQIPGIPLPIKTYELNPRPPHPLALTPAHPTTHPQPPTEVTLQIPADQIILLPPPLP